MDPELTGHTALVIGGSSGIGAATAEVLAEEGCDVAVTYRRSVGGAQRTAARVRELARRAWVLPLDLRSPDSVTRAAEELSASVGPLGVVVVSAGHNVITPFERIGAPEWREVIEVNLTGAFLAVRRIAQTIAVVASPVAEYMTGATIGVNSGRFPR